MKILFFDGYCNLCNQTVDWLVRIDKNSKIKFASLQSETAKKTLPAALLTPATLGTDGADPETVVYFQDGSIHERSTAILKCLVDIGGPMALLAQILFIFPLPLRNSLYRLVAKNRFKLFGRRNTCRVPSEEERTRFLD